MVGKHILDLCRLLNVRDETLQGRGKAPVINVKERNWVSFSIMTQKLNEVRKTVCWRYFERKLRICRNLSS